MKSARVHPPFDRQGHALMSPLTDAQRQARVCTVLIVDANEISSIVLATTLRAAGYGAAIATDLCAAEKSLLSSRPDLILQSLSRSGLHYRQGAARFRGIVRPLAGSAVLIATGSEESGQAWNSVVIFLQRTSRLLWPRRTLRLSRWSPGLCWRSHSHRQSGRCKLALAAARRSMAT